MLDGYYLILIVPRHIGMASVKEIYYHYYSSDFSLAICSPSFAVSVHTLIITNLHVFLPVSCFFLSRAGWWLCPL